MFYFYINLFPVIFLYGKPKAHRKASSERPTSPGIMETQLRNRLKTPRYHIAMVFEGLRAHIVMVLGGLRGPYWGHANTKRRQPLGTIPDGGQREQLLPEPDFSFLSKWTEFDRTDNFILIINQTEFRLVYNKKKIVDTVEIVRICAETKTQFSAVALSSQPGNTTPGVQLSEGLAPPGIMGDPLKPFRTITAHYRIGGFKGGP